MPRSKASRSRRRRRASCASSASPISARTWQAIDTPGSIELLHVATDALLAADAAVICVGPDPAAAVLASPYLHAAEAAGTPAVLFINRIDEATGRVRDIVAALQDYAEHPIVLRQIPIRDGDQITGAVDLVSERAWAYREGEPSQLIEIPAGTLDREHEARGELLEHLSEFDDHLLEELIEDREPPSDEVYSHLRPRAAREPGDRGADRLGRPRQRHRPGDEGAPPRGARRRPCCASGCRRRPVSPSRPSRWSSPAPTASTSARPCSCARSSPSPPGRPLGGRAAGQLTPADPRDSHHLDAVPEGMIVSAVKADHLAAGRLATATELHETPAWHRPQPAIMHRVLAPIAERDSVKLSGALASLAEGDAALTVSQDPATGGALVGAQGPLHLRLLRQRLKDVFGMDVEEVPPSPAYRETISKPQETAYRHKKQTGGAGQFADVKLIVAPGRARRGLHLRRGRQGRRGAAQLHPRGRDRRPRRHGARPARLPGRRRQRSR